MTSMYAKSFDNADEIMTPPKANVSVVKLGDMNAAKMVLEPGWKWSECIKPAVGVTAVRLAMLACSFKVS